MDFKEQLSASLTELKTQLEASTDTKLTKAIETEIGKVNAKFAGLINEADFKAVKDEAKSTSEKLAKVIEAQDAMLAENSRKDLKTESKSFNVLLAEGIAENADKIKSIKKGQSFSMELKAVGDMSFSSNFSTADSSVTTLRPGIIQLPRRRLHIRELLQPGSMDGSTFTYVKEVNGEGNPAAVAEGNFKEQFDLDLQEVDSPSQYIAGWMRISRKMLDDVKGMTTFLQSRLLEKLLRVEDTQLLYGSGVSPNLSGITTSGNFTAANSAATIDVEQIILAASQLEMLDREANGILVSPMDYYRMLLYKASSSGEYTLPGNSGLVNVINGQVYIAGIPVYKSTAMQTDKFIVGDWIDGANLITREAPRVEFFYEDGTNVRENKVTVRVEERVAFPIYGNDYFIYGDLGNS